MQELMAVLSRYSSLKIALHFTENKRTFMSIQKQKDQITFLLDKIFLHAPEFVLQALVRYAEHRKSKDRTIIKRFVYTKQNELDLSHTLNKKKLITKGKYFELQDAYLNVNKKYFQGKMNLNITWFYPRYRTFRHFTFGQYDRCLKLIKINHHLDHMHTPDFYMECLIYHEMLHEYCMPYVDENGRYRVHTKQFKELERKFPYLNEAKKWEKEFLNKFWRSNGRT